ncbi:MAG: transglycosylase domain-containing protein [Deltaproteobacteria bacterium]|nr:transglycosylase domain-containing protein [Deltaproteobacteria bacterium]MBI3295142.1 transglycosylase domain-containing protein [Deltaproteobacteria bacterium]
MEKSSRILLALTIASILTLLAAIGAAVQTFSYTPNFDKLRVKANVATWSRGRVVGSREVGPQVPGWVGLDAISNNLIGAVVSSEDTSFFGHSGVDFYELKESLKKDLKEKRWARGASTITQQVVKNVYLSQEKTLWRKFRELIWAWELDKKLSKSEVLCFYLNMAQWGPNLYGIGQAAHHYFHTSPSRLTARESAFLAMLLPGPEKYYVYFQRKELTEFSKKQIEHILKVMQKMGYIEEGEYEAALHESLWGNNPEVITNEPLESQPDWVPPTAEDQVIEPQSPPERSEPQGGAESPDAQP